VIRFKSGFCAFGIVASLAGPVFAQDCSVADQAALETLRQVMHPEHPSAFAARAVVQTAVGIQQVLVSRGEADASRAGVPVPLHSAACRDPSHRLLFETGSQCGVAQWYKFETISQQLSGRQATVVTALPKDVYRHGFQLVVDDATGIVLRSAAFNGNTALENVELRSMTLATSDVSANSVGADEGEVRQDILDWQASWVPSGFIRASSTAGAIEAQTYTDGLSSFTLFLERPQADIRVGEGLVNRGATIAYTRGMMLDSGPRLVTVVGEVPVNSARMVVESLVWGSAVE